MLGTASVFCHETWCGNLQPVAPGRNKEAITCAVPLNAPGVSIWSRKSYERSAGSAFDSPLASRFDETDSAALGRLLVDVAERGVAVLLVEHDMDLVMSICAQVHVLDYGQVIASGTPEEIRRNPEVQAAYLGALPAEGAGAAGGTP